LLAFGNYTFRIAGVLLLNFWIILDCIDGNIARYQKSSSRYGEFLDALSGYFINAFLFLSVGIGAFSYPEPSFKVINRFFSSGLNESFLIILGAWASLAIILSRLIFHKFQNTFHQTQSFREGFIGKSSKGFIFVIYILIHNLLSPSGFLMPILFLAAFFKLLSLFIFFYSLVSSVILIIAIFKFILKSRKLDKYLKINKRLI